MGKDIWMFLGMTLLIQVHGVRCAVSTKTNGTGSAVSLNEGDEISYPDLKDGGIVKTNSENRQSKRTQLASAAAKRMEDQHNDDNFWMDKKGGQHALVITSKNKSEAVSSSSSSNHKERKPPAPHRNYYLRRAKRDVSDDGYLHRSKRFMIPIGISKKKSNFLDNFRKRVNAIQSNRDKLKSSSSHGMKLNFPFLGNNQNAFSNLRNSLKRIGSKIGKDINFDDDPNRKVTCGKVQCHPRAVCYRSKCRCQRQYTGDGINKCEKMCKCTVSGDPHFHTFDGEILHLMGDCRYILSQSIKFDDDCNFNIDVQNERRGANNMVSWPKSFEFRIYNQTITLGPGENVYMNGEAKKVPFRRLSGNIEVFKVSSSMQVTTKCGIQLSFNGKTIAQLLVPDKYASHLTGLCGDCNGIKDDLKTRDGVDVSKEKNKYSKIGASYISKNSPTTGGKQCNTQDLEAKCSKEKHALFSSSDYCGIITDPNSVFGDCVAADSKSAQQYFDSCMFDVCASHADNDSALCDNIEVFSVHCRDMGFVANWRDRDFCPIKCEDNMHYSPDVSGCPASCMHPDAPSTCILPSSEGCQCDDGMLLNGKSCTHMSMCGCFDQDGDYTSLGEEKMAADCSQVWKCTKKGDHPELVPYKKLKCHENAQCVINDGERMCKCKSGYTGDGYSSCKKGDDKKKEAAASYMKMNMPQRVTCGNITCHPYATCTNGRCLCKQGLRGDGVKVCEESVASYMKMNMPKGVTCGNITCHPYATCFNGRCLCKQGLHGDGVKVCEDVCICSAKGDPHYRTYDGETLTFMGPCRYLLSGTTPKATKCQFRVLVTNEKRGGVGKVTWTKEVEIYIYKLHIRIDSSKKIYVNDEVRYLPSNELGGKIRLFRTGSHAVVSADCGLQVGFDGMHIVKVAAPSSLSKMMTGICGDCDGVKNDIRLKNGTDVSNMAAADTLVANSYRESLDPKKDTPERCYAYPVDTHCLDDEIVKEYCSILKNRTGPFRKCIEGIPDIAEEYYETCRIDVCSYRQNVFMIDQVGCDAVSAMADACEENGILVNWRSSKFCPIICSGVNTTYSYRMTGCPATCVEPDSPKTCKLPNKEGCQCLPGLLLSDDVCVEPSKCGCKTSTGGYLPIGKKQISSDCRHTLICERKDGKAHLTKTKEKECGVQASCVLESDGAYQCKCNDGYAGDPHGKCSETAKYAVLKDSSKCGDCPPNTECLDGECVCKPGFLRNGNNLCEDVCFCAVSGDPHYITFDGQLITYQGACTYLLSKSTDPGDPCVFQIYIKNKLIKDIDRTALPERVELTIYGHEFSISKNETYFDGQLKYPTSTYLNDKVKIFRSGDVNGLSTRCGIKILFGATNTIKVLIPRFFANKLTGLCGDCDRNHDDFRLSNGTDVTDNPKRNNLVGDSYLKPVLSYDKNCYGPNPNICSQKSRSLAKRNDRCGLMEDIKGPFRHCIENAPDLANQFFEVCSVDLCMHASDKDVICRKLTAFADICATLGFPAQWRQKSFCPFKCPQNMEYRSESETCLKSCMEPSNKKCDMVLSEGCSCMTGYITSGNSCVEPNNCGCIYNKTGDYVPRGLKFVSPDCEKFECLGRIEATQPELVSVGKIKCAENAKCSVLPNQTFGCICPEGYIGNGVTFCKVSTVYVQARVPDKMAIPADEPNECSRCHSQAICKNNKCVCRSGYSGDGLKSCKKKCGWYNCPENAECKVVKHRSTCVCRDGFAGNGIDICEKAHCGCSASGDPHYKTFDSTSLYLLGDCKYTMARTVGLPKCAFKVEVKNEHRLYSKFPTRAFTRLVDIKIDGHLYQLRLYKKLQVDGKLHSMPYKNPSETVSVKMEGKFMKLESQCGLKVRFDGVHAVIITLPDLYAGKMEGICGDCDGNPGNDLMYNLRDLSQIANKTAAYEEFARQYLVFDDSDKPATDAICRIK